MTREEETKELITRLYSGHFASIDVRCFRLLCDIATNVASIADSLARMTDGKEVES